MSCYIFDSYLRTLFVTYRVKSLENLTELVWKSILLICVLIIAKRLSSVSLPWRDQADGALSYAAVTRGGLWPPAPSLCRYAERPIDLTG